MACFSVSPKEIAYYWSSFGAMNYLDTIQQYINNLPQEVHQALKEASTIRRYKKGDLLLQQGEVCQRSFHLLTGIARKYYLNEGKEITTEIYFQNDLALSFESYVLQKPGREYIEALTDIEVSATPFKAFRALRKQFPDLMELDVMLSEYYAIWLEQRLFQFYTLSATERYRAILEKSPQLIQHIPLTMLASYLGISLETLSRIRAKI